MAFIPTWVPLAFCTVYTLNPFLAGRRIDLSKPGSSIGIAAKSSFYAQFLLFMVSLLHLTLQGAISSWFSILASFTALLIFSIRSPKELSFWSMKRSRNAIFLTLFLLLGTLLQLSHDAGLVLLCTSTIIWVTSQYYQTRALNNLISDLESTRFKLMSLQSTNHNQKNSPKNLRIAG